MQQTLDAIYERGVLRPLGSIDWLKENSVVQITIRHEDRAGPLAACIGILPDEDARELRQIIADEFERIDPDEWR